MATMTKRLYALAAGLGMVERNGKEDAFHQLVYGVTGKEHVSELTEAEAFSVQRALQERMKMRNRTTPLKKRSKEKKNVPGIRIFLLKEGSLSEHFFLVSNISIAVI